MIDGEVKRGFPYISNIPYIRYDDNWDEILILILRTALDQIYQGLYLKSLRDSLDIDQKNKFSILPFAPEAYSYVYDELKSNIIYPEPPLAKDELDVLKKISNNNKEFLTPMQLFARTINLSGKKVAISVSEAPDSDKIGYGNAMIRDLTIELSRHLLISGASMVYGGDLRKNGYTELFRELSLQYRDYQKEDKKDKFFFRNYFAWPIWLNFTSEMKAQYRNSRVVPKFVDCPEPIAPVNNNNNLIFAKSLLKMRREMESYVNARVLLGGRTYGFKGFMPGVIEEFVQAVKHKHPVYILGGFGGAASLLVSLLTNGLTVDKFISSAKKDDRYNDFCEYCKSNDFDMGYDELNKISVKGFEGLPNNGMSIEENKRIMKSTDIIEIVGLILRGLKNSLTDE